MPRSFFLSSTFRLLLTALLLFPVFPAMAQKLVVMDAGDSSLVNSFLCYSLSDGTHYKEKNGIVDLKHNGPYSISHPRYETLVIENLCSDSSIYLQSLPEELPEIVVKPRDAKNSYKNVILRYQRIMESKSFNEVVYYTNTNKFSKLNVSGHVIDSGLTQSASTLKMKFNGKENSMLFLLDSSSQRWEDFRTDHFAAGAVRKITSLKSFNAHRDLEYYLLNAKSLSKIGFTSSIERVIDDTLLNRTLLVFEGSHSKKQVVFNNADSSLVSFYYQIVSDNGAYECHYALFQDNMISMLYNERVLLLDEGDHRNRFITIHQITFSHKDQNGEERSFSSFADIATQIDAGYVILKPGTSENLRFYEERKRL
jgi:hypothetical protein